jgi:TldD protein
MSNLITLAERQLLSPGGLAAGDLDGVFARLMGPSIDAADL